MLARRYALPLLLIPAILSVLLLPLPLLAGQRFHHDEALYATWALRIVSGQDPWLSNTPIDKPPLYLYTLALVLEILGSSEAAARLPSLAATALTVLLTFGLGRQLYGNRVGGLAAWLVALSPFTLMFAPTAFTDPVLVALVMAACLAAVHGQAAWAGVSLGLAIATKQQGIFFLPLPLTLLILPHSTPHAPCTTYPPSRLTPHVSCFTLALFLTLLPAFLWDYSRTQPSAFLEMSLANYGGLSTDVASFKDRGWGFIYLLQYATASPLLNFIFLIGCPLLLGSGLWRGKRVEAQKGGGESYSQECRLKSAFDWLFFLFSLAFLLLHALLSFQVWDRYLLGLMPLLALLLARVLLWPWTLLSARQWPCTLPGVRGLRTIRTPGRLFGLIGSVGLVLLLSFTLTGPVRDAINARYPLGSDSGALSGIEQIVAYLQGQVGTNHTLYHHWLGTHWRFYLWGYPYDLQYWATPADLATKARPGHLIAFPAWRSDTEARLALFQQGLILHELARAYTPGGAPSIILYEIQADNED
jgi:4-amino-4-deoxy-L-arabinose transferase-like glycosyltransferase